MEVLIPEINLYSVQEKLKKLSKRLKKYGQDEIQFSYSNPFVQVYSDYDGNECQARFVRVTVEGESPKLPGDWKLLGKVELLGEQNLVHSFTETKLDVRFRNLQNSCEHCNKKRSRNAVYVFEGVDGNQIAVGQTCFRDFMGIDDPNLIVHRAANLLTLDQIFEEEREVSFSGGNAYTLSDILSMTALIIREEGWISKAAAQTNGKTSTADHVLASMYKECPTAEDCKLAEDTIAHFRNMEESTNDYIYNLQILLSSDVVSHRHVAFVCSAISTYTRDMASKKAAANSVSNHFGVVGTRYRNEKVLVKSIKYLGDNGFGSVYLYNFDLNGDILVWFSGFHEIAEGSEINIDFTVKEHSVYNGLEQTKITRAKVKK